MKQWVWENYFFLVSLALSFFALCTSGCSTLDAPLDPKVYYKHDMILSVNGLSAMGALVAPRADSYKITITSQEDMDLLQITSCARDIDVDGAIKSGWFNPKRSYTFTYAPNSVEKQSGCILKLAGYNKKEGKHSWAFIVFQDPKFTLPSGVSCNADPDYRSDGVTVCQTLQHLVAQIWFQSRTVLSDKVLERCKIPASKDGLHYVFPVANRECVYEFMEMKAPYRRHQLITVGYESVPIRLDE